MSDLNAKYFALRERFIARLPERLAKMEACLAQLVQGDPSARLELQREAHSLVGAAGLHQLGALAQAAQRLEKLTENHATSELRQALDFLAVRIRTPESAPKQEQTAIEVRLARIFLLCQDQEELSSQQAILETAGHSVRGFSQPEAFLHTLTMESQADLVVLALQFDGDNKRGFEILSELSSSWPDIPVIVFSASHAMKTQLAAYTAGAAAFIAKPVATEVLLDKVKTTLIKQRKSVMRVLAHGCPQGLQALTRIAKKTEIELLTHQDTGAFIEQLADETVDAVILLKSGAAPGLEVLASLINGQPLDRRLPLTVIQSEGLAHISSSWLTGVLRTKLAEHASIREVINRNWTQLYEHKRQRLALDKHAIISIADRTGTVIETSNRMSELLGWPRTALIGSHLWLAQPDEPPAEFDRCAVDSAIKSGIWQGEVALTSRAGEPRWFYTTLVPFLDLHGEPYRYMVIRNHLTGRKLAEQALAESRAKEIVLASRMQAELLVPPLPGCPGGMAVASHFSAASGMGGDFHAMVEHSPTCCDLLIGDVMGKGLHAAIVGAAVKLELHRCLLDLKQDGTLPTPAAIINALDVRLRPKLQAFECFVTLAYLRCDLENELITHVGCGHPETLLIDEHRVSRLDNHHPPLGIVPLTAQDQTITAWPAGASILMYSDGLTETVNDHGQALGEAALIDALIKTDTAQWHPMAMAAAVLDVASRHQGENAQMDDWTLIALRRPKESEHYLELPAQLSSLAALRQSLRNFAADVADQSLLDRAELISAEVFSNIVRHGMDEQDKVRNIGICLQKANGSISLSFHYRGIDFEPTGEHALPEPELLTEGGLGLPLIFSLCDSVRYTNTDGLCSCKLSLLTDKPSSDESAT